ncbi:hypothetical protein YW7DRAFT_03218 [Streptomyces sp. AmelKG-E11A]|nr:hypothetical protein YW7DRAFT_03218 [Streptomyces sp. AmelKG-E11A]
MVLLAAGPVAGLIREATAASAEVDYGSGTSLTTVTVRTEPLTT